MKKRKTLFLILIIIILIILSIIIYKNMTKKTKNGNNMNSQEIVDYILNINSYKAQITVEVKSNKNTNKYVIKQEYKKAEKDEQEVVEPINIKGVKIKKEGNKLTVENTNLSLSTIFEEYKGLGENALDLHQFIDDYKSSENSKYEEKDGQIIMYATSNNENKYTKNKALYINKENFIPTKLVVKDNNQNMTINIQYNNIELN